jgi:predicted dehydrogenase
MIRTGIIGLGKMGLSHCSILGAHPEVDLVAACDTSGLILEAMSKYSPIKVYTDYKKMIGENELNCVFVATPTKYHAEMVIYSLENNLHVFCEKPFSLHINDGEKMVRLAKEKKRITQVGYHNRFLGTFNEIKRLIEFQVLGDIYHFLGEAYGPVVLKKKGGTWRSETSEGGGCLFDYASHVINLINYILGNITNAEGTLLKKIYSKNVEDAVYSTLFLKNGLSGILSVNWSDETYRKMSTQITVMGTEGKIISNAQELRIYLKKENKKLKLEKGWTIKYVTDLTAPVNFYLRGEEYSAQIDYFINCIKENELNNRSSFESALQTDYVIESLKKDAERR